jgi:hypothetical protein
VLLHDRTLSSVAHPAPAQTPTSPTPDDVLLGNLIPEGTSQVTAEDSVKGEGPGESVVKANKGMILRKSVEYIRYGPSPSVLSRFNHLDANTT